jgi:uncharacterized membrane protein YgdD (TMEM256/DUF423 family)
MWLLAGAILGGLAVAIGAFGAHGLPRALHYDSTVEGSEERRWLDRRIENFETAARYHMYHALAIVAVGLTLLWLGRGEAEAATSAPLACQVAGWLFLAGIVIFSGCLYVLALTGQRWLGAVVPIGGVAFILGWLALAAAALFTPD